MTSFMARPSIVEEIREQEGGVRPLGGVADDLAAPPDGTGAAQVQRAVVVGILAAYRVGCGRAALLEDVGSAVRTAARFEGARNSTLPGPTAGRRDALGSRSAMIPASGSIMTMLPLCIDGRPVGSSFGSVGAADPSGRRVMVGTPDTQAGLSTSSLPLPYGSFSASMTHTSPMGGASPPQLPC